MTGPHHAGAVDYASADGLGVIRLNRPQARNAIDPAFVDDLHEAVQRCAADETLRALLIRAEGPSFTVGGDVAMLAQDRTRRTARDAAPDHHQLPRQPCRSWTACQSRWSTAVHGAVAGGGLGLIYVANIVLAAEGTRFTAGFGGLGLSGDGGGTWFLPRLVGMRRAAELYFGQRVLQADEAAAWGLITRVVREKDLTAEAESAARQLAAGPTRALAEIRTLLRRSPDASLGDQLLGRDRRASRTVATRDAAHGIECFMTKSRPEFRGW